MPIILNTDLGAESKVLKKYVPNVQGANCLLTQMDRKVISGLCYNRCKHIVQWKCTRVSIPQENESWEKERQSQKSGDLGVYTDSQLLHCQPCS